MNKRRALEEKARNPGSKFLLNKFLFKQRRVLFNREGSELLTICSPDATSKTCSEASRSPPLLLRRFYNKNTCMYTPPVCAVPSARRRLEGRMNNRELHLGAQVYLRRVQSAKWWSEKTLLRALEMQIWYSEEGTKTTKQITKGTAKAAGRKSERASEREHGKRA